MREIRTVDNQDVMSREAAKEFVELGRAAITARGCFVVALSGGSTPRAIYRVLVAPPLRDQIDWSKIEFFWGDERPVPPDHSDSNFGMARAELLEKVAPPKERIHRMEAERTDRDAAAREYEGEIARVFGVRPDGTPPAFDLILLGMGPDGHTASLFPGTTALHERARWVVPNWVEKFHAERVTFTAPIINRAREIRFLVAGADKAPSLRAVLEGPPDAEQFPSQLISGEAGRLVWLVDRAAAAELKSGGSRA